MNHRVLAGYLLATLVLSGCGNGLAKRARAFLGVYPTIREISPIAGAISGKTKVVITGTDFSDDSIVLFNEVPCTSIVVNSPTTIHCVTPANPAGRVDLKLVTGKTTFPGINLYTYEPIPTVVTVSPSAGSPGAGNNIVITGTGLLSAQSVTIGGNLCTNLSIISATKISCTVPAGVLGTFDLVVTNDEGVSTTTGTYSYSSTASISAISPSGGPMSGGTLVTITGDGFRPKATVKVGGIVCSTVTVVSPTSITCTAGVSANEGFSDVEVTNADHQTAVGAGLFFYEGAPTVASVTPSGGPTAGGTTITLTGTRFLTATGITVGGVACTSLNIISKTSITCVTPAVAAGAADIAVTNGGGPGILAGAFTYAPNPTVTSISPAFGGIAGGAIVTITGTNFQTGATVTIGTTACAGFSVDSNTQITCTTPSGSAGVVSAKVTNLDAQSGTGGSFTYDAAPTLGAVSPTSGPLPGGTTITLAGTGFLSTTEVRIGGNLCGSLSVTNDISLTCVTPASTIAAPVGIAVTNASGTSTSAGAFTYNPPPTIASGISPSAGSALGGTVIRVAGTNFGAGTTVTVGGNICTGVSVVSSAVLTCSTSAHASGLAAVVVTNADGQSATASNSFTFENNATLTSISPVYGSPSGGLTVTLTGTGFLTVSRVTLGGAECGSLNLVNATTVTCVTPSHAAGVVDVVVINGNGPTTLSQAFTYADPAIASVTPVAGTTGGGNTITITGTDFRPGATVTVGGIPCTSITVVSSTSITCVTPAVAEGPTTIVVTNVSGGSGTKAAAFTFEASPTLTAVSPNVGPLGGGTTITLTGTRFLSVTGVTVGGNPCSSISVVSPTSLTCISPAGIAGAKDVAVTNATGIIAMIGAFTYALPPTISNVSPSAGATGGGTLLTITGTGFAATPTVTIDGFVCGSPSFINATQVTCTTPAHVPGATTIVVTNPDGQIATGTNLITYEGVPTVGSLAPANGPKSGGTTVTLTGTGFLSATTVRIGGVVCGSLSLVSATSVTCVTPVGLVSGGVDVAVTNAAGSGSLINGFSYDAPPSLTSNVLPLAGTTVGSTRLQLTGLNFVNGLGVLVGGVACTSINFVSSTSITCLTPSHVAGLVDIVVTNPDGQSYTAIGAFTYEGSPTVSAISPSSGPVGGGKLVTLTGTNFLTVSGVTIGGSTCTGLISLSATSLRCFTPAHAAGTVDVIATNTTGSGSLLASYTFSGVPTVTEISPKGGGIGGGTAVTLSGTNFVSGATVTIGGITCTSPTVATSTRITCSTGAVAAGTYDVVVTNLDTSTGTGTNLFVYENAPTLASVSPTTGATAGGTTLSLTGTGFLSATGVTIAGVACTSLVKVNAGKVTCITPAHAAATVDVNIANETGNITLAASFTYANPPTVTSVSPSAGKIAGGDDISITGTNYAAGATVAIGGVPCGNVTVVSPTQITCTTSATAAGTLSIVVTNTDGQTGTGNNLFTYEGAPVLISISPSGGPTAGGNSISLNGSGFLTATGITVGGVACSAIGLSSSTVATCVVPTALAGAADVAITNTTATATLVGAYTYRAAPTVGSVAPGNGPIGGGTTITLTGTGFVAGAAVTVDGNSCANVNVTSSTTITCLTPSGTAGLKSIVVTNADKQSVTGANLFTYVGAPTITTVSPTAGPVGGGTSLTVNGTNLSTTVLVKVGAITCTGLVVVGPTQITCNTPASAAGAADVVLINSGGTATSIGAYTYRNAPTVASVSPSSGSSAGGTTLTLTGTNFLAGATVTVGGSACTAVAIVSSTSITCTSPAHAAGAVNVVVTSTEGQTGTGTNAYTYEGTPTLSLVTPNTGSLAGGTSITVSGTNFLSATGVTIGGVACTSLKITNAASLSCVTPVGSAGAKAVAVTNPSGTGTLPSSFTYQAPPVINTVTPTAGAIAGGDLVTISGTGFLAGATVLFNGVACTAVTVVSATSLTCTTPANAAGSVIIKVTNTDTQSGMLNSGFRYEGAPTLSSITPASGSITGGNTVTLAGTQFATATSVSIGGNACTSLVKVSPTSLTCTTPAKAAASYNVVVTNPTGSATLINGFTYYPGPTVTAISPTTGGTAGGAAVTVTGTNFRAGATVKIGSVACGTVTVVSATSITCTTGAAVAGSYNVAVTNTGGDFAESPTNLFTYEAVPTITTISPSSGSAQGGLKITITGTGFLSATGVTIGGTSCGTFVPMSATQVTCVTPAKSGGAYTVAVTNAAGIGSKASGFSYNTFAARAYYAAHPTGDGRIFIWGGIAGGAAANNGEIYDPVTNSWATVSATNAPSARYRAVSELVNGNKIFIWGGTNGATYLNDGKLYNPATDTWTNVSATGAPAARSLARSVVHDGKYVLIAGGVVASNALVSGASFYNVAEDTWITPAGGDKVKGYGASAFVANCSGSNRKRGSSYTDDDDHEDNSAYAVFWGGATFSPSFSTFSNGFRTAVPPKAAESWAASGSTAFPLDKKSTTPGFIDAAVINRSLTEPKVWGGQDSTTFSGSLQMHTYTCVGNGRAMWASEASGAAMGKFLLPPGLQAIFQTTGSNPNYQEMLLWGGGFNNAIYSSGGFTITSVNGKKMDFQPAVSTIGAPSSRGGHAIVTSFVPGVGVHDRKFYVLGGIGPGGYDATASMYNAATNTWSAIATP